MGTKGSGRALAALAVALAGCGGVGAATKRCDAGDGPACAALARRADVGDGVPRDAARAVAWRAQACQRGLAAECRRAGFALAFGVGVAPDPERAVALLGRGCEAGDARSCASQGMLLAPASGVLGDGVRALRQLAEACRRGSAAGCYQAARLHEGGDVDGADAGQTAGYDRRAAELAEQTCGAEPDPLDCRALGAMAETGSGVPADLRRAAAAYDQACRAGDPFGCVRWARLVEAGAVRGAEPVSAAVYRQACDDGAFPGCEVLAEKAGKGGAQEWLERACGHGGGRACFRAGSALAETAPERAADLFRRGCASRDAASCVEVARRTERGEGLVPSARRAAELWERLCVSGDVTACRSAARLWSTGGPDLLRDPRRARDLVERACGLGDEPACEETAAAR